MSYKSDEPPDDDMTGRHIISAMIRNVDLTEMFSPARVVEACKRHGLVRGESFDLRTGYDLTNDTTQRHVKTQIEKSGTVLVICSPPCTKFSQLQELNLYLNDEKWAEEFEKERQLAIKHIDFCLGLMRGQQRRGRYFLFEHPAYATSWKLLRCRSS